MKIVVEVSEKDYLNFMLQYDSGILDEKTPSHRAKIAIAEGQILPDNSEILTAEAYSDLCLRASEKSPCALCKWHKVGEDTYCWECNARPIEEGAEECRL